MYPVMKALQKNISLPRRRPGKKGNPSIPGKGAGKDDFSIKGRIWISKGESTFLGYGRVVLLERIKEYGSITRAAKSMGMSYRNAWELVDSINSQSDKPLVDRCSGGKGGGGTVLTRHGEKALALFWKLRSDFMKFTKDKEKELSAFHE